MTTTTTTAKKQEMIAISSEFKSFVVEQTEKFGAASASKEYLAASQKEICDAMLEFVQANREQEVIESDDEGNQITRKVDGFALEVFRTLALRSATSRANSAASKLQEKEKELIELRAMLAKLQGNA